jgi:hypothetical protein
MRMKRLLGLVAIGGAIAYAQKKRGGELTIEGFKKTFRDLLGNAGAGKGPMKSGRRAPDEDVPGYGSQGAGTTTRSTYGSDFSSGANGTGGSGGGRIP